LKKLTFRLLICIVIVNITVLPLFFVLIGYGATGEIDSKIGEPPIIDGDINLLSGEWNQAAKEEFLLEDLPIKLWVMQDDFNLYIAIQFELEQGYHNATEFVGLIISNSSSENRADFIDAKILQFSNITTDEFEYLDYNVNNSIFSIDSENNGNGVASLDGINSIYEFSIPIINDIGNKEDVVLDFGNLYAFNITYGETPTYPEGVKKSTIVLINLSSISSSPPSLTSIIIFSFCIVVFSILGILYGYYIYKIFKLKEKIERIRR
jgi:hypothetical protein